MIGFNERDGQELDLQPQKAVKAGDVVGSLFRTSNVFGAMSTSHNINKKYDKLEQQEIEQGIKFSWTSPKTKEMLDGLPDEFVENLSAEDITSYSRLQAAIDIYTSNARDNARIYNSLGTVGGTAASIGFGILTDPTTFQLPVAGSAITGTKTAAKVLHNASKLQKRTIAGVVGAEVGLAYEEAMTAGKGTEDTEEKIFAAAFGGILGGAFGASALDLPYKEGTTPIDKIAKGVTDDSYKDALIQASNRDGILKTPIGKIYSPTTRLLSHEDPRVREAAQLLVNTPVAFKDVKNNKNIVVSSWRTAQDFKQELIGEHTTTLSTINQLHTQAKQRGYKGSFDAFMKEVHSSYVFSKNKAEKELWSNIKVNELPTLPKGTKLEKGTTEIAERIKLWLQDNQPNIKYEHNNPYVKQGAEHLAGYFNKQAEHLRTSHKDFENIKPNGHLPRAFNVKELEGDKDGFIEDLAHAMSKHPANSGISFEDLLKEAEGVYNKVLDAHYFKDVDTYSKPSLSSIKNRKLTYSDADMYKWLNKDLGLITSKYSRDTSGLIATAKTLGVSNKTDFKNKLKDLLGRDVDPSVYDDFDVLYDALRGTREIPRSKTLWDHTLRMATKTSRMIFSPGFALAASAEFATPIATHGFFTTLKAILPGFTETLKSIKGLPHQNTTVKELQQFGLVGKILESKQLNRFDSEDTQHMALKGVGGKFENFLDKANHFIHTKMGLSYLTEAARTTTLVSGVNWLNNLGKALESGKTLSHHDIKALARLGLNVDDVKGIRESVTTFGKEKYNTIQELNIDKWDDALTDKFTRALERDMSQTVLEPDGTSLPTWMSDPNSVLAKVTMQFTRYPMGAYQQLTMKGLDEMSAQQFVSIMANMSIIAAIAQIKDLSREKKLYDTDTEEGRRNLYMYMVTNSYFTGALTPVLDKTLNLMGIHIGSAFNPMGTNIVTGPIGSVINGVTTTSNSLFSGDPKLANSINIVHHSWMFNMFMGLSNKLLDGDTKNYDMSGFTISTPKETNTTTPINNTKDEQNVSKKFLEEVEGKTYKFTIPRDSDGKPLGNSSWTIGTGIDLGQQSAKGLINKGVPLELVSKLKPLLGKRGKSYKGELPKLTKSEVDLLSDIAVRDGVNVLKDKLKGKWDSLLPAVKTVALSLYHQFGNKLFRYNAWKQIKSNDIKGLVANLRNFGDKYPTRRNKEADLIEGVLNA